MFTEDIEGDSESESGDETKSSRRTCKYMLKLKSLNCLFNDVTGLEVCTRGALYSITINTVGNCFAQ